MADVFGALLGTEECYEMFYALDQRSHIALRRVAPVRTGIATNDSVIKLVRAGLSEDLIVQTVNSQPKT